MRRENDAYMTPDALANAIVARLAPLADPLAPAPFCVLEPSAGEGSFVRACAAQQWRVFAIEKSHTAGLAMIPAHNVLCADFLATDPGYGFAVDLVIGNPPYKQGERFVRHAMKWVKEGGYVAFLLRLSFLASQERIFGLYQQHPLFALAAIAPRPSYTGTGNDNSEYGMFVWKRGFTGTGLIDRPIIWRK